MNRLKNYPFLQVTKVIFNIAWFGLLVWIIINAIIVPAVTFFSTGKFQFIIVPSYPPRNLAMEFVWIAGNFGKVALFLFIVYQIRTIFKNLTIKHPFEKENMCRIRTVGFTLIAVSILSLATNAIYYGKFILRGEYKIFLGMLGAHTLELKFVFAGLIVLVVAEIFRFGLEMREEQNLTI